MTRARSLVLLVLVAAVLVSCSDDDDAAEGDSATDAASEQSTDDGDEATGADGGRTDVAAEGGGVAATVQLGRDVVRTAELSMIVDDLTEAAAGAVRIAEDAGGFQASSTLDLAAEAPTGSVVLRVPTIEFAGVVAALGRLGEVADQRTGSEDVTGAVVDLEARIAAARVSVERVRGFLDRTSNVPELAGVERELLTRESELESLVGQLAAVRQRVDLATVTARFGVEAAPTLSSEPEPSDDIPAPSRALRHGWVLLVDFAKAAAAAAAFALPFAMVVVPALVIRKVVQRRPRRLAP